MNTLRITVILIAFLSSNSWGCKPNIHFLPGNNPKYAFDSSDAVFLGEVREVASVDGQEQHVMFSIEMKYKGDLRESAVVINRVANTCDAAIEVSDSRKYIVFATYSESGGHLKVSQGKFLSSRDRGYTEAINFLSKQ